MSVTEPGDDDTIPASRARAGGVVPSLPADALPHAPNPEGPQRPRRPSSAIVERAPATPPRPTDAGRAVPASLVRAHAATARRRLATIVVVAGVVVAAGLLVIVFLLLH